MDARFRAAQKGRPDLRGAGAESQRGGHAAPIGDAAGGDDRNANRIDDRRQQREQPDQLALGRGLIEAAAMAAGLHALCGDDVRAGGFGRARLRDRRDIGDPGDPFRFQALDEISRVQPHHRGNGGRRRLEHRLALGGEINERGVSRRFRDHGSQAAKNSRVARSRAGSRGAPDRGSRD